MHSVEGSTANARILCCPSLLNQAISTCAYIWLNSMLFSYYPLGVKVRNMKMDCDIYGTWHRVWQWTLMMKIYDFFIRLSGLVASYKNMSKIFHLRDDFFILLYGAPKPLSRIKKIHKFSSLVFIARPDAKCHKC